MSRAAAPSPAACSFSREESELYLDDMAFAFERLFRVQLRDEQRTAPFVVNKCQERLLALVYRIRALNKRLTELARAERPDAIAFEGGRIIIAKCRRGGVSTVVQAIAMLHCTVLDNYPVLTMAHKGANAEEVFRYSRQFHRWWPVEYNDQRPEVVIEREAKTEYANGSRIVTQTAGGANQARSFQFALYHFSEPAHYDDYSEVNAAISAAPPHAWIFEESTANGLGGGYYNRWKGAREIDDIERAVEQRDWATIAEWKKGGGFIRFFFSWLDDPRYIEHVFEREEEQILATLDPYEKSLRRAGASTAQIKWRRGKLGVMQSENKTGLSDEQWFMQEFPATADEMFQSSGNTVFDGVLLNAMELRAAGWRREKAPRYLKYNGRHAPEETYLSAANLTLYEMPEPGALYVVGADSGYGVGKDDSVALVFDRTDGTMLREVAAFRSNVIEAGAFGDVLTFLGELFNRAFLVPEGGLGPGIETCSRIVANRYPGIYHRKSLDTVRDEAPTNSFRFGFATTGSSKHLLVERTRTAVKDGTLELRSPWVLAQMRMYTKLLNGGYGAPPGEKDDGVIGACLGVFGHTAPGAAPPVTSRQMRARAEKGAASTNPDTLAFWKSLLAPKPVQTAVQRLRDRYLGTPGR